MVEEVYTRVLHRAGSRIAELFGLRFNQRIRAHWPNGAGVSIKKVRRRNETIEYHIFCTWKNDKMDLLHGEPRAKVCFSSGGNGQYIADLVLRSLLTDDPGNDDWLVQYYPLLTVEKTIEIFNVVTEDIARETAQLTQATLPERTDSNQAQSGEDAYVFRKSGDFWEIVYDGEKLPPLKHLKGYDYIAHLLDNPHREFDVMELVAVVEKHPSVTEDGEVDWGNSDEILGKKAREAYKNRLHELVEEREQAERDNDQARLLIINDEYEQIAQQLRANTGLGGKSRKFNTSREKARINIQKRIRRAVDEISEHSPALAEHLRSAIATGGKCVYDSPIRWKTSSV